jgi:hypothetical protein
MANSTSEREFDYGGGAGPFTFHLAVKGATTIYRGTLVSQSSSGYLVPYSTAASGSCVGVAEHSAANDGADGDVRCYVQSKRMVTLANGTAGDAFADTDQIGSLVFGTDDHTAAKTSGSQARKPVGFFYGFESDGKVRVFVDPASARIVALLQALTDSPASADALRDNIVTSFG